VTAMAGPGTALSAMTGIMQSDTQAAWPTKAAANLGGDGLMSSKRESLPSVKTRRKRYVPTGSQLVLAVRQRGVFAMTHGAEPRV
jgi:hypothetical protein